MAPMRVAAALTLGICAAGVGIGVAQAGQDSAGAPPVTQTDPEFITDSATAGRVSAMVAASSIQGRVTGVGGSAAAGYLVEAYASDGNFMNDARSDSDGRYMLASLQPGPYKIKASPPPGGTPSWAAGWAGGSAGLLTAQVYSLGTTALTVDVQLPRAAGLSGQVQSLPPGPATVTACGQSFLDCRTANVNASGRFAMTGLPAGNVSVSLRVGTRAPLVFPKQPPRPGVRVVAGATTQIVLNAATQGAPQVTATSPPKIPVPVRRDTAVPAVTRATLVRVGPARWVQVRATDNIGLARLQVSVDGRVRVSSGFTAARVAVPGNGAVAVRVSDTSGNWSPWRPAR